MENKKETEETKCLLCGRVIPQEGSIFELCARCFTHFVESGQLVSMYILLLSEQLRRYKAIPKKDKATRRKLDDETIRLFHRIRAFNSLALAKVKKANRFYLRQAWDAMDAKHKALYGDFYTFCLSYQNHQNQKNNQGVE